MTERQPNKANLVSDPQEECFEYSIIDDDGVAWYAAPTEKPSAFVKWVPSTAIQRLSAASRRGARVRKLIKAFRDAFRRHKGEPAPKMVKMYRQGRRPKDLLADMRKSGSRISRW